MTDRQIEVLEKVWEALAEMEVILHPNEESALVRELFEIIKEQQVVNYAQCKRPE